MNCQSEVVNAKFYLVCDDLLINDDTTKSLNIAVKYGKLNSSQSCPDDQEGRLDTLQSHQFHFDNDINQDFYLSVCSYTPRVDEECDNSNPSLNLAADEHCYVKSNLEILS